MRIAISVLFVASMALADVRENIEALVGAYRDQGRFSGSVLAATDGEVVYAGGVGMANVEWGIPNAPDTRFRIGSITKQFTAAVILQLVAEGNIDLDAPMTTYVPDYPGTGDRVTIHHLLTHSSGIPSYTSNPDFLDDARITYEVDEFIEKYCSGDLEFEPGTEFRYNNSGYFLLGAIIETVTGNTYAQELQARIFEPLGLSGTGYDTHEAIIEKRANGYTPTYDGLENSAFLAMSSPYSAGSLYSTVEDLERWDRALRSGEVLGKREHRLMFSPHIEARTAHYGYGWILERRLVGPDSVDVVQHAGGINGFTAFLVRVPTEKRVVVALANVEGGDARRLAYDVLALARGSTVEPPKPNGLVQLKATLDTDGPEAAVKLYHSMVADSTGGFAPGPWELHRLGTELAGGGRTDAAIVVLEALAEIDSKTPWHQVALAEAYEKTGNEEGQVRAYAQALALAPKEGYIRKRLGRLLAE